MDLGLFSADNGCYSAGEVSRIQQLSGTIGALWGTALNTEEAALIRHYLAGDQRAFQKLISGHTDKLMCVARRYAPQQVDPQDIMQVALWKAAQGLNSFRQESSLSTWLYRLVVNTAHDFARRQPQTTCICLDNMEDQAVEHDIELGIELSLALSSLPNEQREALILVDLAGTTIEHVAQYQGVRPGTVKSRRARARKALRQKLQGEYQSLLQR